MSIPAVRLQEKGQVTIPLEIRKKLGLKKGDLVAFLETDSGVVIKPAEVIVAESLNKIGEALKAKGIDLDQLMEEARERRAELITDEYNLPDADA